MLSGSSHLETVASAVKAAGQRSKRTKTSYITDDLARSARGVFVCNVTYSSALEKEAQITWATDQFSESSSAWPVLWRSVRRDRRTRSTPTTKSSRRLRRRRPPGRVRCWTGATRWRGGPPQSQPRRRPSRHPSRYTARSILTFRSIEHPSKCFFVGGGRGGSRGRGGGIAGGTELHDGTAEKAEGRHSAAFQE